MVCNSLNVFKCKNSPWKPCLLHLKIEKFHEYPLLGIGLAMLLMSFWSILFFFFEKFLHLLGQRFINHNQQVSWQKPSSDPAIKPSNTISLSSRTNSNPPRKLIRIHWSSYSAVIKRRLRLYIVLFADIHELVRYQLRLKILSSLQIIEVLNTNIWQIICTYRNGWRKYGSIFKC